MQIKMKAENGGGSSLADMMYGHGAGQSVKKRRLSSEVNLPSSSSCSSLIKSAERLDLNHIVSPIDYVLAAFSSPSNKSTESDLFKHRPSEEDIAGYSLEVVVAMRARDLTKLRSFHAEGKSLSCCNRFGEALIHMACRRSYTEIVRFMVEEAGVSLFVHDDFGRTPMHYSCWTAQPNLELLDFLVQKAPSLLLMCDVRGHMPMNYVRTEHWGQWINFLQDRRHLIKPDQVPEDEA
jgi:hypothetical protein